MVKPRPGPKLPSCKGMPPVRYKSIAILKVARLIKDSGPEMRLLLKSDVPREQVPTARETAALRADAERAAQFAKQARR